MTFFSTEEYTCCFCGKRIVSTRTDPLEIGVRSMGDEADAESGAQGLYSHYECLRQRLAAEVPLVGDDY